MRIGRQLRRAAGLLRSTRGAVVVEFALIAPALLAMLFGVLQLGLGMQNYNALRSISADVARHAVVNYQTANKLSTSQLQAYARTVASAPPYGLQADRLIATVDLAPTQRVTGAREFTVRLQYDVPSFLGVIGINSIPIDYSRPIFVIP
ncbi:MAG: hypothetical protein RL702_1048 [Pseudomonadota bacterium]|nr:pilus assembly protein [Novosphingobium sp.]HPB21122.1 pilus assembly protein [Novosphingobium sp.]HPZ48030.1 pilus assembly protein [Novosphingobium sp.]HQE00086.1 pilus assembly protein [Novosphingobium sp.]HQQ08177.1 pilus assembly protein [Novosphingobium sp.]